MSNPLQAYKDAVQALSVKSLELTSENVMTLNNELVRLAQAVTNAHILLLEASRPRPPPCPPSSPSFEFPLGAVVIQH